VSYAQDKPKACPTMRSAQAYSSQLSALNQRCKHTFDFRGLLGQSSRRARMWRDSNTKSPVCGSMWGMLQLAMASEARLPPRVRPTSLPAIENRKLRGIVLQLVLDLQECARGTARTSKRCLCFCKSLFTLSDEPISPVKRRECGTPRRVRLAIAAATECAVRRRLASTLRGSASRGVRRGRSCVAPARATARAL
jgi:hypothetical protein